MNMRVFGSAAELLAAQGESIGPGPWRTISQAQIDSFAATTGDGQWIHTDPDRARTGPYGATIAHGYLTLSLLPVLGAELYALDFGSARINYGGNTYRFPAPVRSGTAIRAVATIAQVTVQDTRTVLTVRWTIENEGQVKPVCIAETLTVVLS
ncbi:MaoC family dehydratase [Nocardia sp. NPDC057668]|uniref:MaoC family dehydratase n=1 Tax=Nocardia sp. NPDC057668 TaxID=3346202 RepID=UPI00366AAF09